MNAHSPSRGRWRGVYLITLCPMNTRIINDICLYLKTQPVLKVWLFGSFSRGEAGPTSDVDLLVAYDRSRPIGLFKIGNITNTLRRITGREVDLVDEDTVFPWVKENIDNEKILIYERTS